MRRAPLALVIAGAVVAAAVCGPATAAAQSSDSVLVIGGGGPAATVVDIPARITGRLVVQFHGDPATGCATRGLCGYTGTILWTPPASTGLTIYETRSHGLRHDQASLFFSGLGEGPGSNAGATDANVEQTLPASGQPGTSCADTASAGSNIALAVRRGRVRFSLGRAIPSPLQTRCAGPLLGDVASALAAPSPTLRAALHGMITLDLAGAHSFASHGFAGSVDSTLTIRLGRPHHRRTLSSRSAGPTERYRQVRLSYRAAITGSVSAAVSGDANQGLCGPLGVCGQHGTLSLVPPAGSVSAQFLAAGLARRPERDFLTALGLSTAGRARGITVYGEAGSTSGGVVTADMQQGSASCRDSASLGGSQILLAANRGRLGAQYLAGDFSGGSVRTRCPGPFARSNTLASGTAPLRILSQRVVRLSLTGGHPFVDDGYSGASSSNLTLTLTRRRLRTFVLRVPKGTIG